VLNQPSVQETWGRLALFLSRDVLERRYKERHGGDLSAGKAKEIISQLAQAREYFVSAETSGPLVRPLLQYYGVLGSARALVLFGSSSAREASMNPAHGLTVTWSGSEELDDLRIECSNGTFYELLKSTGNVERFFVQTRDLSNSMVYVPWNQRALAPLAAPSLNTQFSLIDLLARIPSVESIFELALNKPARCYPALIVADQNGLATIVTVHPGRHHLPRAEELRNALGLPNNVRAEGQTGAIPTPVQLFISRSIPGSILDGLPPIVRTGEPAQNYVVELFSGGWCLSSLASLFAGSYVLSTLVRYHATRWAALVNHERGDKWLPVLDRLRDVIQTTFPALVLEELDDQWA
jgi:hypothetical protein